MAERPSSIPRDLLEKYFRDDPRLIAAFEEQSLAVAEVAEVAEGAVTGTQRMQDATVVTLSPNEDLTNEFILTDGDGTKLAIVAGSVKVDADKTVARVLDNDVTFVSPAPGVKLFLPLEGELTSNVIPQIMYNKSLEKPVMSSPIVNGLGNYDTDAEAAAGGVPINGLYRDGNVVCIRRT